MDYDGGSCWIDCPTGLFLFGFRELCNLGLVGWLESAHASDTSGFSAAGSASGPTAAATTKSNGSNGFAALLDRSGEDAFVLVCISAQ